METKMDYEVKADMLEESFSTVEHPAPAADKPVVSPSARPALSGAKSEENPAKAAFVNDYLRKGLQAGVQLKALDGAVPGDGGFAIPREIDATIDHTLKAISPIRAIANVVQVGTSGYRKLVTLGNTNSGWGSELAARPDTNTAVFNEVVPPMGDLYANPAASQAMLDDAFFDVESWLADEISREFARAEGAAFVNGTGINQPAGFLTAPTATTSDAVRPFGTLQYMATGVDAAFPGTTPEEKLMDLVQSLRAPYRQGAVFVMNAATMNKIRKFRIGTGALLWQASLADGRPDTLLGYPVIDAEDMPDIASGSFSIAFGNFKAGYLITERAETSILRDPYSVKPFVHFYAHKRIGGTVANSEAIKLMKFGVS
jgi:HK97 family phage major capsid protein